MWVFVVLGTEPRALCMLGKYSTAELPPQFHRVCVCVRVHVRVCSMGYGFEILPGE